MSISVLIADDEPLARADIRARLARESRIEIIGEAQDGPSVVEALRVLKPDLVFLDVQMPGFDGLEALKQVGSEHLPTVIFVTAHDHYAVRAFDLHALDYLLKPVNAKRFRQALDRALYQLRDAGALNQRQQNLAAAVYSRDRGDALGTSPPQSFSGTDYITRVAVKGRHGYIILKIQDVDWIRSAANYVELHAGDRTLLLRTSLTELQQRLDPSVFARIHRTQVVNIERISDILPSAHGDSTIRLHDGTSLRLSSKYRGQFIPRMYPRGVKASQG